MTLSKDWYEIARKGIVIGHCEATWLVGAHEVAEMMFPEIPADEINCYVVRSKRLLSDIGDKYWTKSRVG